MAARVSVDEARALIGAALSPLAEERLPLDAAAGRTLARPIKATRDQPPFDASAMDGYAVRLSEASEAGARLDVAGESAAGKRFAGALPRASAVRIFTGAPVPKGADHILIQEDAERDGESVIVRTRQTATEHIRRAGGDFAAGADLIPAGARLDGARLALAAAANVATVHARRRPKIALIANGDELAPPGANLKPDEVVSSIPFALADFVARWGGEPCFLGIARDDLHDIRGRIDAGANSDVIVPIGGASVGDRDLMRQAFLDKGFRPIFEKVAVRPGMPAWLASDGRRHVLGLPGNPASALVTSVLFLRPAIARLLGAQDEVEFVAARLAQSLPRNGPRESYLRARFEISSEGVALARAFPHQDSSLISVMAAANALIRRAPDAREAAAGDLVECMRI